MAERTIAAVRGLEARTTNAFRWELLNVADRLATSADFLAAVMAFESAGTFSPAVRNPGGARGLIQFMPSTAERLGTSSGGLSWMSAVMQLGYVERYYRPFRGRLSSVEAVHMATFLPGLVGAPASTVVGRKDDPSSPPGVAPLTLGQVYAENRGLDRDKDGTITIADIAVGSRAALDGSAARPRIVVTEPSAAGAVLLLALGVAGAGAAYVTRRRWYRP